MHLSQHSSPHQDRKAEAVLQSLKVRLWLHVLAKHLRDCQAAYTHTHTLLDSCGSKKAIVVRVDVHVARRELGTGAECPVTSSHAISACSRPCGAGH